MKDLLRAFEDKAPEIVFEWQDAETDAKGWAVINTLRGGAAGGGTRMRKGLDKHEVVSLAKTMEIKFAISGPHIGGAKSGINFDPQDPRKEGVLKRWYKAVMPLLKSYYGTGGDLNVFEMTEVNPITEDFGLWHPQEGVVTGHFHPSEQQRIEKISQLRDGVSMIVKSPEFTPDPTRDYTVGDMITGYGVAESVRHFYELSGDTAKGKRFIVQGWGTVGAAGAYYLAAQGAQLVGILDRECGLVSTEGLSFEQVRELFLNRSGNTLESKDAIPADEAMEKVWSVGADVFLPCAASRLVSRQNLEAMKENGVKVLACGANVPFRDDDIFYGSTAEFADANFSVIPDFIANSAMARAFNYLMSQKVSLDESGIFNDASQTIYNALKVVVDRAPEGKKLSATALEYVLEQLKN
jgi:glutamate dehydrogenase/leucine dehydrogenase